MPASPLACPVGCTGCNRVVSHIGTGISDERNAWFHCRQHLTASIKTCRSRARERLASLSAADLRQRR